MQNLSWIGLAVALVSGLTVGVQATIFTALGRDLGPLRASLVINGAAGLLAGAIMLAWIAWRGIGDWHLSRSMILPAFLAVAMGIGIVTGIAFSFQRMGLGAGIATVFLGQMLVGVIIDTLGRSGVDAIPLDPRRIIGLVIMAVAVWLLVPNK